MISRVAFTSHDPIVSFDAISNHKNNDILQIPRQLRDFSSIIDTVDLLLSIINT